MTDPPPPQSWGTPPPAPQPTWSQPPVPGAYDSPPPSGSSKLPWIVGAAAMVLVLVVVGLVLLLRGGSDAGDPESTARSFVEAAKEGDCEAFTELTTRHFQDTYGRCSGDVDTTAFLGSDIVTISDDVTITDETDDTATADVDVSAMGFTVPLQLLLVREGDAWLVDEVTVAGFGVDDIPSFDPGQPAS